MDDLYRPNYDQLIEDAREFHRTFRDGFDDLEEFLKEVRRSFRSGDDAAEYLSDVSSVAHIISLNGKLSNRRLGRAIDKYILTGETPRFYREKLLRSFKESLEALRRM